MNLRLAISKEKDTVEIVDLDNSDFRQDVSNDFKFCIVKWLNFNDDKRSIFGDSKLHKISMKSFYAVEETE